MALLRPFASRIVLSGVGLCLLFTLLAPESSAPLSFLPRLAYWGLHIGIGLSAAVVMARLVLKIRPETRDWLVVVISGLLGVLLFAPFAVGLEHLFGMSEIDADNDFMDQLARTSAVMAIVVEAVELAPPFMAAWLLINLEPVKAVFTGGTRYSSTTGSGPDGDARKASEESASAEILAFADRLPPIIGSELVCVSSDLHYLNVVTRKGQAMILGSLQELEDAYGDKGLRVHRSHWVNVDAVTSLSKSGKGWFLNLVGDHRVPVSRRKRSEITDRLGEDFSRSVVV